LAAQPQKEGKQMNDWKIQEKISGVNKVELAVADDVELFNPQKGMRMMQEYNDRRSVGYFDFELLQQEGKEILSVLRSYKGCVGMIVGYRLFFRDMAIVENQLKKFGVVKNMYATGNQRLLPVIMSQRMAVVIPQIMHPILASGLQISRGLLLYGLARKVLRKKGGRDWAKIKIAIANQADKMNVDYNIGLNRNNYSEYLNRLLKQVEDADMSYSLKAMMVLVDNEPQKLSNLAVAVTEIVMGDSVDKLLLEKKSKPIGIVSNRSDFAKDFLKELLSFRNYEQLGNPVVDYRRHFCPWFINALQVGDTNALTNFNAIFYIKTVAEIDVVELTQSSVVPMLLEAEFFGAIANITDIHTKPLSGSTKIFKEAITGSKISYENSIFGHQEMRSDLKFVFVGETSSDFDSAKSEGVEFDLYQLGNNIPWDYQLQKEWAQCRTTEKVLLLTFLLMLGLEEMSSSGSDAEIVRQSDSDAFLEDCCMKVPVTAGEKLTAENAVPIKTLNKAIQQYLCNDNVKISKEYLIKKGFRIAENSKSSAVFKYYSGLGYTADELLCPRTGGNHVLGLRLKSKQEIKAAKCSYRIRNQKTQLSDEDFIRFFYDQFEKLLRKYSQQFQKGTGNIERR